MWHKSINNEQMPFSLFMLVLILCHVKVAYLPHKKQESAFIDVAQKYQKQESAPLKI